jgi:general secretion pathway protein E
MIKTLSEQLLSDKALTKAQLNAAEKKAQETNTSITNYLITEKIVPEETIANTFSKMLSLPYIEKITEEMVNPDLLAKIPFKFLKDNSIIPIKHEDSLVITIANPNNYQAIDEMRMLLSEQTLLAVSTPKVIQETINKYYPLEGTKEMIEELGEEEAIDGEEVEFGGIDEGDLLGMAQEAPIIKMVNHTLFQAVKQEASDIHIEPQEKELIIRYRIDGILHPAFNPPKRIQGALVSRIKIMANLNIAEKRKPQDGGIQIKIADKAIDIRVSILPTIFGEKIVMRLQDKSRGYIPLEKLGLSERDYEILIHSIKLPNGIIMVTGPTGSGKTTTLYAVLNRLNKPNVSIVTVEDPVEFQMNGIAQVQVNAKAGITFASALRSILRQDPDIIMIGETRDQETAQIAIQASLTGHLVLSTLHTNNAPASITRMLDMGVEPYLIASSVTCIMAQRLVRKLCPQCKKQFKPDAAMIKSLGLTEKEAQKITFYQAVGCNICSSGYKGRLPIFEIMQMSPTIARLTIERTDSNRIRQAAMKEGMTLLIQDGIEKIKAGLTTIDEVLSVAANEQTETE